MRGRRSKSRAARWAARRFDNSRGRRHRVGPKHTRTPHRTRTALQPLAGGSAPQDRQRATASARRGHQRSGTRTGKPPPPRSGLVPRSRVSCAGGSLSPKYRRRTRLPRPRRSDTRPSPPRRQTSDRCRPLEHSNHHCSRSRCDRPATATSQSTRRKRKRPRARTRTPQPRAAVSSPPRDHSLTSSEEASSPP